jgi:hypothetical protein
MRARPEVKETMIAAKIRRWRTIAKNPQGFDINPSIARRNYWRLCKRYPEIMEKLGFTITSCY